MLKHIFRARITELKDEAVFTPRGFERDAKLDLVQELLMWLRDIKVLEEGDVERKPEPIV